MSYDCMRPRQQIAWESRSPRAIVSRIRQLSSYLAKSVEATLQITRGAGGAAISMSMKLCGVVFNESPAFALFPSYKPGLGWPDLSTVEASVLLMRGLVSKLEILFRESKASPTDVDSYGNTLFHVCG